MPDIDLDALLEEISYDTPCGEDLEYDPEFGELDRAAQEKPEQQFGETIIPAEPPNWKEVRELALNLLNRTKDLRVACHLVRGVLGDRGLIEFTSAMALIRGYVEQYWETVHPQLDPDDDNDPVFRINTLSSLTDSDSTLRQLQETPIVESRMMGKYSLFDVAIASGELSAPSDMDAVPDTASIDAAFTDCEVEDLQANSDAVNQAIEHVEAIESTVTDQVGASNSVSLSSLVDKLRQIQEIYREHLIRRGVATDSDDGESEGDGEDDGSGEGHVLSGEIRSREDVIRALDKVCQYYERYEPSSPLPLLIQRAKRLATKSFIEIIRDLTPEGLSQAESIGGISSDSDSESEDEY